MNLGAFMGIVMYLPATTDTPTDPGTGTCTVTTENSTIDTDTDVITTTYAFENYSTDGTMTFILQRKHL